MRWLRKAAIIPAVAALAVLGTGTQASASSNLGWWYTFSGTGFSTSGAFFDGDLNGYPGVEKITVCDNESDGRGVVAMAESTVSGTTYWVYDQSNDGKCSSASSNMFPEEEWIYVEVCEYAGSNRYNCNEGAWIA
ncbi:hypothetical protein V6V47_08360 [Micromonospora sp. CPCC 205539]|uniref:hypothetical protein n=1 Tax=Micromonospora sp. CPCC 205539 TaxID=3122408 RepID=UPI002FF31426